MLLNLVLGWRHTAYCVSIVQKEGPARFYTWTFWDMLMFLKSLGTVLNKSTKVASYTDHTIGSIDEEYDSFRDLASLAGMKSE